MVENYSVKNISYTAYLDLEDKSEIDFLIKYSTLFNSPNDFFKVGDFFELEFGLIKDLQSDLSKEFRFDQFIEYASKITGLKIQNICKVGILDLCQFRNYLISQIELISTIEENALRTEQDIYSEMSGSERLNIFGVQLQIRELAGNDVLKFEFVRKTKYKTCFVELCARKELNEYEKRRAANMKKKM